MWPDDDFASMERQARDARRKHDVDDLNNEIADREVGRAKRFLPGEASPRAAKKRREITRETTSALMALMRAPGYAALHRAAMKDLGRYEAATEMALAAAEGRLDAAKDDLARISHGLLVGLGVG